MIVRDLIALMKAASIITERVENRIYPQELPEAPAYPAIVVTKASGVPMYDMEGDTGTNNARVQVDCYSDKGYDEMLNVKEAVKGYLSGYRGGDHTGEAACAIQGIFVINDMDLPVEKTDRGGPRLRRRMLELRIWSK